MSAWADLKKPKPATPPAAAAAAVAAAESSAEALEREMEDAEGLFADESPAAAAAPSPAAAEEAEPAVAKLARTQRETLEKETIIRQSLAEQQKKVQSEARRLALFESELQKLKVKEAEEVGVLRSKLEECDRDIVWLQRDFKNKEAAYLKAKEAHEGAVARKRGICENLALLVLSSEKRKEEKLNELMQRMNAASEDTAPTDEQLLG